ncbi:MAG: hypothetical protein ACTSR3_14350 [Candidatus Helarchaeota archaeon]
MDVFDQHQPNNKGVLKTLGKVMDRGELYSCGNFTIFAKNILVKDSDFEYETKYAVVYDEQADMLITGELGLRFIGKVMIKGEIIETLKQENKLKELWDPQFICKNGKYSEFLIKDEDILNACSELINEDYIAKLIERINHNTQFLEELKKLKDELDPSDPNFGESFLTLETAITEITDKINKLRNLLDYGGTDIIEPYE